MTNHQEETKDLLNRLQSHNWAEYKNLSTATIPAPFGPTPDEKYLEKHATELTHDQLVNLLEGEVDVQT